MGFALASPAELHMQHPLGAGLVSFPFCRLTNLQASRHTNGEETCAIDTRDARQPELLSA